MSDKVYCYPESDVLINKLNIHDLNRLSEAERKLTQLRLNDLVISPVQGDFDLRHLQKIAYYFSEINALHPFREGNGRSQREFIRELAMQQGYTVRFAGISAEEMLEASLDSFICNYGKMEALFKKVLQ